MVSLKTRTEIFTLHLFSLFSEESQIPFYSHIASQKMEKKRSNHLVINRLFQYVCLREVCLISISSFQIKQKSEFCHHA